MECGIIGAKDAAVVVGILFGLDLHAPGVIIGNNKHLQFISFLFEVGCDVKFASLEGTLDASQVGAIKRYLCLPVDAVKVEENTFAHHLLGQVKRSPVDEIPVKERFRSQHQVVVMVHVGQCPGIDITR